MFERGDRQRRRDPLNKRRSKRLTRQSSPSWVDYDGKNLTDPKLDHFVRLGVCGRSRRSSRLSLTERLSTLDRRSPVSRFSSSERTSVPDRLSPVVRLSVPERFSSSPIACLPLVAENHTGSDILSRVAGARKLPVRVSRFLIASCSEEGALSRLFSNSSRI
jgi:hypothetical protein